MAELSVNVANHLAALAASEPNRNALIVAARDQPISFGKLHAISDNIALGLNAIGIGRGTRVAMMVPPSIEFFAMTFALLKTAAVPVMIDPGMGIKNLGLCLDEAEPEAFVGIAKAHLARRLLGWGRRTIRTTVNIGISRFFCTRSSNELMKPSLPLRPFAPPTVTPDDPAAILFTSGSTGVAKGAVYTHGIFAAQVEMLKAEYGIAPGEVDLCTFPLFALFGPALGMSCIIPDMNASRPATIDPAKTIAAMERYHVTNFFGSPAVIRRLSQHADPRKLVHLRRVISAGAPASPASLETFAQSYLAEGVPIYTPYGATEALPVANIGSDEILKETRHLTATGHGVCVGRPFDGMTVHIIRICDDPIAAWDESLLVPRGEVGEIVVRGPVVTKRYHNRDAATKLAKILDPRTGETLHRMGDVGYFDDRDRLWFCGRKSHRVATSNGTLFTDMVEPIFENLPSVARAALVGVSQDGRKVPAVCIERFSPRNEPIAWDDLVPLLKARGREFAHTKSIELFLEYPGMFPVDVRHNSKIFREKLAVWASRRLASRSRSRQPSLSKEGV